MTKQYIGYINDNSSSMRSKAKAAIVDYNARINAVREAATKYMLDTVVSVVAVGYPSGYNVQRQVVISNPHVLKPVTEWATEGGTPLWDGIMDMIQLLESLPDSGNENVSFLIDTTTDGMDEYSRRYTKQQVASKIAEKQRTGRWTFTFRIPEGFRHYLNGLNVPQDNIYEWSNNAEGLAKSTVATAAAVDTFYAGRSAGAKSSTVFYANAAAVDTSALKDITADVSLYVVPQDAGRLEIRDFILKHRMEYLKGAAFYQLTKTEPRVSHAKMIAVRDRSTGKIYAGKEARQMIGLPTDRNSRLHPGDHGNYDIFIQSESVNRLLVPGTGVVYYPAVGTQFTEADLAYLKPKAVPAVVQLPAVPVSTKPTPSPIPKAAPVALIPSVDGKPAKFFDKRDDAREYARLYNKSQKDVNNYDSYVGSEGKRWFVFL